MWGAVRSWSVSLGALGEVQWGESNYLLDTLYLRQGQFPAISRWPDIAVFSDFARIYADFDSKL
jgi:hypothetical protein